MKHRLHTSSFIGVPGRPRLRRRFTEKCGPPGTPLNEEKRRRFLAACVFIGAACLCSSNAFANYACFAGNLDSISFTGFTNVSSEMTMEAEVRIPSSVVSAYGRIFAEQLDSQSDKNLSIWSGGMAASTWVGVGSAGISQAASLTPDSWHDVAFVRDQDQESLYLDGSLIATESLIGTPYDLPIQSASGSNIAIGAYNYSDGHTMDPAFLGDFQWVRIDASALYSGTRVIVPTAAPEPDATTQLLGISMQLLHFAQGTGWSQVANAPLAGTRFSTT